MTLRKPILAVAISLLCVLTAASCTGADNQPSTTPDTDIQTPTEPGQSVTEEDMTVEYPTDKETADAAETSGEPETAKAAEIPAAGTQNAVYAKSETPDFGQYMNDKNIERALTGKGCVAIAAGGSKAWVSDGYVACKSVPLDLDGRKLTVNAAALSDLVGKTVTGDSIDAVAASLGMNYVIYENELALFYPGDTSPLDTFNNYYTLEALRLNLVEAGESDIANAFIDLPSVISNNKNYAAYYTSPDISLAVQTDVYYRQLGDNAAVATGPAIVAGEGRSADNHTLVRVLNRQQICTAQFLAYPADVTGGVEVHAAQVGEGDTVIVTAAYSPDVRYINVFDPIGTKRAVILPDARIPAPYTVLTGKFLPDVESEVALITTGTVGDDGQIIAALYAPADGTLLKIFTLDFSFAKGDAPQFSARKNADGEDTVIIYLPGKNTAYEGSAATLTFDWIGIQLPDNAAGVYASSDPAIKYTVSLKMTDATKDRSFVRLYGDGTDEWGNETDVGFKENVFYSSRAEDNDYAYVDNCSFQHIRADISNSARQSLAGAKTNESFDSIARGLTYENYAFSGVQGIQKDYLSRNVMLEPCFTHRWNAGAFTGFVKYTDENGNHKYAAVGKSGEYLEYLELGSSFDNGTYADGLLVLAKLRIYPLRTFTRALAGTFRGNNGDPSKLIGISPVHEQEINVDGSVGDYNPNMVKGFAYYLAAQYGSIENINARFGTEFATLDELDAPRGSGRGTWDSMVSRRGKSISEFGQMWTMYNRNIINKRIMEAYREALLAGFPPETISSHQIPEGDAVGGFLGQADTRLSPVDVVMSSGTAFGATRYGSFYGSPNNFIAIAHGAGHNAIELGEYSSLYETADDAYKQLSYLWKNGVRVNHIITFNDAQSNAETLAVRRLAEENRPRPGYTTGTDNILGVAQAGKTYDIVEIGQGDDAIGLLKSVSADGSWEGTVYVVPFHSHVNVTPVTVTQSGDGVYVSDKIRGMQNGDQVEFTFDALYTGTGSARVTVGVRHAGYDVEAAGVVFTLTGELTQYRYVLSNQISPEDLEVTFTFEADDKSAVSVGNITAVLETECVGRKYFEGDKAYLSSVAHRGGVTFDLLTRDMRG